MPTEQRRQDERVPLNVPGELLLPGTPAQQVVLLDLSRNGVSFLLDRALPSSTEARLRFRLPHGESWDEVQVRAVYALPCPDHPGSFRCGARIGAMPEDTGVRLAHFLSHP
ncbi:MAG: PilZ domain-containing protein [Telluria sp.]